jgi:hypothetical protein
VKNAAQYQQRCTCLAPGQHTSAASLSGLLTDQSSLVPGPIMSVGLARYPSLMAWYRTRRSFAAAAHCPMSFGSCSKNTCDGQQNGILKYSIHLIRHLPQALSLPRSRPPRRAAFSCMRSETHLPTYPPEVCVAEFTPQCLTAYAIVPVPGKASLPLRSVGRTKR